VQEFFDAEIKKLKLKPYYFPLFVTENVLQKEKDHIEGFAPEVCLLLFPSYLHFQILTVRIFVQFFKSVCPTIIFSHGHLCKKKGK